MRYAMWDKQSDIFTLGRDVETGKMQWTAQEYIEHHAPWAAIPSVKIVVGGGLINGTVFMEFEATKEHYISQGAEIDENMTDEEVLQAIEDFENNPPGAGIPSAEERTAAALEFANLLNM